ncbi:MAG: response regulator transcription factor, partial [Gammaproteobacteria bacterium]|nr:response regulator transcription factor [Gammaproteobacteria bacterium]
MSKNQSLLGNARLLYLLEGDELFSSELILILERANYQVRSFTGLRDFESACETEIPAVIVIDFVRNGSAALVTEAVSRLKAKFEVCPPLVFISASDDIEER